jgi:uncharacterized protein (TIGR00304 family)
MKLQTAPSFNILPVVLIVAGFVLVLIGLIFLGRKSQASDENAKAESKGIILIGPIPIVWGFSRKATIAIAAVAVAIFLLTIILWLY